jgi:hypothetical protein
MGASALAARARSGRPVVVARPTGTEAVFRRDGQLWLFTFAGRTGRLPEAKGLRDLAILLAQPGIDIPATDLLAGPGLPTEAGADEILDAAARATYRNRLIELEQDIGRRRIPQ